MDKKEIDSLLSKGEDYKTEFKENLSGIEKDIVAFSNTNGGIILIGVSDDKKIRGIVINNKIKAEIQSIARNCDPQIIVSISNFDNVLVVSVPESTNKPHRCREGFYLRIGPISQKLNVDEIRELFNRHGKLFFEEIVNSKFVIKDFSKIKFNEFLKKAKISKNLKEDDLLYNLGITVSKGKFKNAGILLFGKEPSRFLPQSVITCVLYKGTDKAFIIDRKDFKSDILSNYHEAIGFLYRNLKLKYEIKGFDPRKEILEIPEEALKEAVINAICHRDYFEKGAVIQIDIFDDRVEISNPGGLIIKESEFGKRSLSRNPLLFGLLQRVRIVEHVGSGIERIRKAVFNAGLPEPKFEFGKFFAVTFQRPDWISDKDEDMGEKTTQKTTHKTTQKILEIILRNPSITRKELAGEIGISEDGIKYNLNKLVKEGKLRRIGPDKGGYWKVVK